MMITVIMMRARMMMMMMRMVMTMAVMMMMSITRSSGPSRAARTRPCRTSGPPTA